MNTFIKVLHRPTAINQLSDLFIEANPDPDTPDEIEIEFTTDLHKEIIKSWMADLGWTHDMICDYYPELLKYRIDTNADSVHDGEAVEEWISLGDDFIQVTNDYNLIVYKDECEPLEIKCGTKHICHKIIKHLN